MRGSEALAAPTGAPPSAAPATTADDAWLALQLAAMDPAGLGGVLLRTGEGGDHLGWLAELRQLADALALPLRRLPPHADAAVLLGAVDLTASLAAGRRVLRPGLLAGASGGLVLLPMADQAGPALLSHLHEALDGGWVTGADGAPHAARIGVVAWESGAEDGEVAAGLADRLALHLALPARLTDRPAIATLVAAVRDARERLADTSVTDAQITALCAAARRLGIDSVRAGVLAVRAARASAALAGRSVADDDDLRLAARLVLAPRAVALVGDPEPPPEAASEPDEPASPPPSAAGRDDDAVPPDEPARSAEELGELVVAAARAVLPGGLPIARMRPRQGGAGGRRGGGRPETRAGRGRPGRLRQELPRDGLRLDLMATLLAAAPWQVVRAAAAGAEVTADAAAPRVRVRRSDLRVRGRKRPPAATTVFVVDASGSTALNRLAEVKGAVELLLAESYVRRDEVALVSFRGRGADVMLPPSRALARARALLSALPGGGGSPLAAGLASGAELLRAARQGGREPRLVLLTDGRANVALDGTPGRAGAEADALRMAALLRALDVPVVCVDASPRGEPFARRLAAACGATYVALPRLDARAMHAAVSPLLDAARGGARVAS